MAKGNRPTAIKYTSSDKTLFNDKNAISVTVEQEAKFVKMRNQYKYNTKGPDVEVYQATSDGKGNITFNYAKPEKREETNHKYGEWFDVKQTYNVNSGYMIRGGTITYAGIDWNNVKSVSGKSYGIKDELKKRGFKWDGNSWSKR